MGVVENVVRMMPELGGDIVNNLSILRAPVKLQLQPLRDVEEDRYHEAWQDVDHQVKS